MYRVLTKQLRALFNNEHDFLSNTAQFTSFVYHQVPKLNWVGFYFLKHEELVLGPFQGKVACVRIAMGRGVCGQAAKARRSLLVNDVQQFQGHISCDADSRSEIVIPLIIKDVLWGVFDIDSPLPNRFNETDLLGLEQLLQIYIEETRGFEVLAFDALSLEALP